MDWLKQMNHDPGLLDAQIFTRLITAYVEQAWDAFRQKKPFVWHNPVAI